jgi:hypothetical protein
MKINIRDVKVKWINLDQDEEKNEQMKEIVNRLGFRNASRFSAVSGIEPHENVRHGEEHYRSCAESHFTILQEAIDNNDFPILILEDDVEVENAIPDVIDALNEELEVPDDIDALYLGTSHGDQRYVATDMGNGWLKLRGVFATHAIVYFNADLARDVIKHGEEWIYEKCLPFDLCLAYKLQNEYNVYSPHNPWFYQSDAKNTVNKWESITRTPLVKTKKFSVHSI